MDKKTEKLYRARTTKDLMWGMATYTGSSILGPLVILGVLGYGLDWYFSTQPLFLIAGVLLAFITTNILVFKKLKKLNQEVEKEFLRNKEQEKDKTEQDQSNNQN